MRLFPSQRLHIGPTGLRQALTIGRSTKPLEVQCDVALDTMTT